MNITPNTGSVVMTLQTSPPCFNPKNYHHQTHPNQHPPTGCLKSLTGGFWAPVVTRKHLARRVQEHVILSCLLDKQVSALLIFFAATHNSSTRPNVSLTLVQYGFLDILYRTSGWDWENISGTGTRFQGRGKAGLPDSPRFSLRKIRSPFWRITSWKKCI